MVEHKPDLAAWAAAPDLAYWLAHPDVEHAAPKEAESGGDHPILLWLKRRLGRDDEAEIDETRFAGAEPKRRCDIEVLGQSAPDYRFLANCADVEHIALYFDMMGSEEWPFGCWTAMIWLAREGAPTGATAQAREPEPVA